MSLITKQKIGRIFSLFKLYVVGGTSYEYIFRNAEDPVKKRIWTELMEPYTELENYPSVRITVFNIV